MADKFETIDLDDVEKMQRLSMPELNNGNISDGDPLDDNTLNDNDRLRDCSDDDNLKSLGRKVSEIVNANRLVSNIDNGNGNDLIPTHR